MTACIILMDEKILVLFSLGSIIILSIANNHLTNIYMLQVFSSVETFL